MAKVHKEGVPLRPVVSMIKTSEYCFAKYLDTYIQPNLPISYSVNSTTQFTDCLKTFVFSAESKIISFDVVSFFTNVPLEETINIICKKVYSPQNLKKPPFKQLIFKRMLFQHVKVYLCIKVNISSNLMAWLWEAPLDLP